jgi:protein-S-isoprenylcysteine O-methyltransferase Ste14
MNESAHTTAATALPRKPPVVYIPPPGLAAVLGLAAWGLSYALTAPVPWLMIWPLSLAMAIFGCALAVSGVITFLRAGTEVAPHSTTNKLLIIRGPFRFTRNPMYLGLLIVLLGVPLSSGYWLQWLAAIVFFLIINTFYVPFEEAKMERQFGDEYRDYKQQVRRWI